MKSSISLSINPTYRCNLRCNFCYLSNEQLSSNQQIEILDLFERLQDISFVRKIDHIDFYGGEISILDDAYLSKVFETIEFFFKGKINVITNLTLMNPTVLNHDLDLTVSWDFLFRSQFQEVYKNMLTLEKPFHILVLASYGVVTMDDEKLNEMISLLNNIPKLVSVEIKPYSNNLYRSMDVPFELFEGWVKKWIARSESFNFEFINEKKIKSSLLNKLNSWSDDHIYITPSGKFAVLEFDDLNREYFKTMDSFNDYLFWTEIEKQKVRNNVVCKRCDYLGHCLSEHLQNVPEDAKSCNGFRNLLTWYKNERL